MTKWEFNPFTGTLDIAPEKTYALVQASEALTAGDAVNVHSASGAFRVRRASAVDRDHKADGYVKSAVLSGSNAKVFFEGTNEFATGLAPGNRFLSSTLPGRTQTIAPTIAGQIVQKVGVALTTSSYDFEAHQIIIVA